MLKVIASFPSNFIFYIARAIKGIESFRKVRIRGVKDEI